LKEASSLAVITGYCVKEASSLSMITGYYVKEASIHHWLLCKGGCWVLEDEYIFDDLSWLDEETQDPSSVPLSQMEMPNTFASQLLL
jgi:hypothetical protein